MLHSTEPEHVQLSNELRLNHTLLYHSVVLNSSVDPQQLNDDPQYQQYTNALKSTLIQTEMELDQQVDYHNAIAARITQRNNLASEVEYYSKKFHGLQEDRTRRASNSKVEKPADAEKFDRNQRKLTDVRQEYLDASAAITEELRALLNARGQVYGRTLLNISNVERQLGYTLTHINKSTESIDIPNPVPTQPPSLLSTVPMHTNSNVSPVNGEIPSINQATTTAVTSGSTRATDGSELLAKNQAILPPINKDAYNVSHPYDNRGQLRGDAVNTPRTGVDNESVYNATPEQLAAVIPTHGPVVPTRRNPSLSNASSTNNINTNTITSQIADVDDRPATTSYNTGNAINTASADELHHNTQDAVQDETTPAINNDSVESSLESQNVEHAPADVTTTTHTVTQNVPIHDEPITNISEVTAAPSSAYDNESSVTKSQDNQHVGDNITAPIEGGEEHQMSPEAENVIGEGVNDNDDNTTSSSTTTTTPTTEGEPEQPHESGISKLIHSVLG